MAEGTIQILQPGDEAPTFELRGTDGEMHTLDEFDDNEALLIVFTCNHCPYAQAKEGALNALANDYDEVAVVGINPNDPEQYPEDSFETMQEWVAEGRLQIDAYLHNETQEVAKAYGAVCTPDPFLFAKENGTFTLAHHGRLDDATNPDDEPSGDPGFEMRAAIEAVLAGEPVDVDPQPSRGCTIKWFDGNEPDYWDQI